MTGAVLTAIAVLVLAARGRPRPGRRPGDATAAPLPPRVGPRTGRRWFRHAEPAPDARDWARFLDAVAAHIRGGTAVRAAVDGVLQAQPCVGQVVRAPLRLDLLGQARVDDPDEAVVVHSLATAVVLGGPTAAILQAGANLLRERAAVRAEAQAHSAQARLSARVLTLVPLCFAGWSAVASATFRRALLSPVGLASATAGVVVNTIGWWWMRRIVGRAVA